MAWNRFIKTDLLNKTPRVSRLPKCPSSAGVRKCLSAFSTRVPSVRKPQVLESPSALSAQVPLECSSIAQVPLQCPLSVQRPFECSSIKKSLHIAANGFFLNGSFFEKIQNTLHNEIRCASFTQITYKHSQSSGRVYRYLGSQRALGCSEGTRRDILYS